HAGEDLAWRSSLRSSTKAAIDFSAQPERADFQTFHVIGAMELAPKPAAHAHPGIACHERLYGERSIELVPQRLTPSYIDPGNVLLRRETEWDRCVEHRGWLFALPVERRGVAHLGNSRSDRVKHFEGRHQLARGVHRNL